MKFYTPVEIDELPVKLSPGEKVMTLGSCFSDSMASRLRDAGFDVCANPFGTLYNPASICSAVLRLDGGSAISTGGAPCGNQVITPRGAPLFYGADDCVKMGAGADLWCSFEHHTSFARATKEEFLEAANSALESACEFWKVCHKIVITLGTAFVWRHEVSDGSKNLLNAYISGNETKLHRILTILFCADYSKKVVSNCLKIPSKEFDYEMLKLDEISSLLDWLVSAHPDKEFIFTVSPIRHLGKVDARHPACGPASAFPQGAQANTLSKSALHLAVAETCAAHPSRACCFPAFEILCDELRDYRFYADDLVHPSSAAAGYIWERFVQAAVPAAAHEAVRANEKAARQSAHRPNLLGKH